MTISHEDTSVQSVVCLFNFYDYDFSLILCNVNNLDWGQHVSENSCKATKIMGFLRRNLALAPKHTKEVAYKTLVRPQLEYAAPIWNPYHKLQIQEVEKVLRTAARWTKIQDTRYKKLYLKSVTI